MNPSKGAFFLKGEATISAASYPGKVTYDNNDDNIGSLTLLMSDFPTNRSD